jgi:Aldehyde dehydrogenase family
VEAIIQTTLEEGATLLAGGKRPTEPELAGGYFLRPTVLGNCNRDMTAVRQEVFGPVITVERFAPRTRRLPSPTTPTTASPVGSGLTTPHAPNVSPHGCATELSGSTTSIPTSPKRNGEDSASQGSVENSAPWVWRSTGRPNTSIKILPLSARNGSEGESKSSVRHAPRENQWGFHDSPADPRRTFAHHTRL